MAKNTAAVVEDEAVEAELTPKQIIKEAIDRVIEETGVDGTHFRYKAMRAIAYQAFNEAIEADDFDGLVDRAIEASGDLPAGWGLEKAAPAEVEEKPKASKAKATKEAPAKPAKKVAAKTATKAAPAKKAAGRRRPARDA